MKLRFLESKPFCFESFKQALTDTKKCKHLCVTNKRNRLETSYSLGIERIPLSKEEKDLGVLISHNPSWHNDIMAKVNIAMNKVLRLIKACQGRSVTARDLAGKQCRSEIKQCSNHMITICRLTDWTLWLSEIIPAVKSGKKRSMKNASRNWYGVKLIWLSGS